MSRVFAYCRVPTFDQTTKNQIIEINTSRFTIASNRIIEENISGSVAAKQRPGFCKLVDRLESGDILVVTKLDRLGRNAMDVRSTVELLEKANIRLHCLALGGVDLTSQAGKMTMGIITAVAEFERDLLIERTQSALQRAKEEGISLGRPKKLNGEQHDEIKNQKSKINKLLIRIFLRLREILTSVDKQLCGLEIVKNITVFCTTPIRTQLRYPLSIAKCTYGKNRFDLLCLFD